MRLRPKGDIGTRTDPALSTNPVGTKLGRLVWVQVAMMAACGAPAATTFTSIHSFQVFTNGFTPYAGLLLCSDGNFYGTTYYGGTNTGAGTVFKIGTNGVLTTVHSFSPGIDGANPVGGLVQGRDGSLYGTTYYGGAHNSGAIFKMTTNGSLTGLYAFTGGADGGLPVCTLVQGKDGGLYGTTSKGGTSGDGTVFRISTNGGAPATLHSFTGGADGWIPQAGLIQGSDGNLYGTTFYGGDGYGTTGPGAVFMITTNGVLTPLHGFTGGNDGGNPAAALVEASDGNFYGTTSDFGTNRYYGGVFKINTSGAITQLYAFTGAADGGEPSGALVQSTDGSLYGTTTVGGTNGAGAIFRITTNGALTSLYSLIGPIDGAIPNGALVEGSDGKLYGTAAEGGSTTLGTVFNITTNGALTSLYSFSAGSGDGSNPYGGLVRAGDGSLYGTTVAGGANGGGTVFNISTNGLFTLLHSFAGGNDGAHSYAGLVQGSDGNLYGTTLRGGAYTNQYGQGQGIVFKIGTNGALTSLYSFTGENDGGGPSGGLVQGTDGSLYGTTGVGGTDGGGTIFRISTNGTLSSLFSFITNTDGGGPTDALAEGGDGSFYGTTSYGDTGNAGTVFKWTTNGQFTLLHSYVGGNDGGTYHAGLVQATDGNFYGTAYYGGDGGGTVFRISSEGALTGLYSFTGGGDGANPYAGLVQGSDGNLYGTTVAGGTNGVGAVFKISTNGVLTRLYSFTGSNDGAYPYAGLAQGSDGRLYGTTERGGEGGAGTIFRLTVPGLVPPAFQPVTVSNGTLSLTWTTETGERYQLQYTSDLGSINWTNLGGVLTASGETLSATDSVSNGPGRFYRVVFLGDP